MMNLMMIITGANARHGAITGIGLGTRWKQNLVDGLNIILDQSLEKTLMVRTT